jgi:hypothetical protein
MLPIILVSVGDEEAVAAPVGLPVTGSATLIGRVGRWGVLLWRQTYQP